MSGNLIASLVPLPQPAALEAEWRDLEVRSTCSFFLSWHWIGSWLDCMPNPDAAELLRVECEGRVVGLGILFQRTTWRHGFVRSRGLHLNSTGDPSLDEINVEYNGMLAEKKLEGPALEAALCLLLSRNASWDEFHLPGLGSSDTLGALAVAGAMVHRRNESPCRFVDLDALRATGKSYLDALGRSTRYNVRRSQREYAADGELTLDEASTVDEAVAFLGHLRTLHQNYWVGRGEPGSFSNAFFAKFHERLVRTTFASGTIQLLRVRAGAHEVGYLYNFVHRRHVYNYQSGFDYGESGNLHRRPGMVAHSLAVEHNAARGASAYDFLAGDTDLKRSLATASTPMAWCVVQRPREIFRIENELRRLRRRLRRVIEPAAKSDGAETPT